MEDMLPGFSTTQAADGHYQVREHRVTHVWNGWIRHEAHGEIVATFPTAWLAREWVNNRLAALRSAV